MSIEAASDKSAPRPGSLAARLLALDLPLALRLALRDLRGGLKGFYVFVACVALGVAVISGVGALSDGIRSSFARQGEVLLGGDVALNRVHRRIEPQELSMLAARGRVSEVATMRAMSQRLDGEEQALVEIKAVDGHYPLAGAVVIDGGVPFAEAMRGTGAAVDPILLERLRLRVGDRIRLGSAELEIRGTIKVEPDKIADRMMFGPRVLVSHDTLERTELVKPGSLIAWRYRIRLPDSATKDAAALKSMREELKKSMPDGGFTLHDRFDPSPGITRGIERLRQFLTLIGVAALIVGGVGVANAVATFIDRKRRTIATLKSVGAPGGLIFRMYLIEVLLIAGLGILIGLLLGGLIPVVVKQFYADALPVRLDLTTSPRSLAFAALYGLLVSLVFILLPLGRARQVQAAVLFRDEVGEREGRPSNGILLVTALIAAALVVFAVATSDSKSIALWFCLGLAGILALFTGLGSVIARLAARVPRPSRPELALALGNLGGPGGLTRSVVLSLGAGLTLLTTVAIVDAALIAEMTGRLPKQAPSYFFLNVTKGEHDRFVELLRREAPDGHIDEAPMLRGRLVKLGERPVEEVKAPPEHQWVLQGDRGLSYSETVPPNSRVVAGAWWPRDYTGEPLVSFDAEIARSFGLKIGDTVTVNVLGRNISARIANFREVKWENLAINFVMVFSPNTLQSAPHNLLVTVSLPDTTRLETEARLSQVVGRQFPSVTPIRVKDAIDQFNAIFGKVMTAVRVAGSVTLIAGALVLAGAMATAQRRRIKQAVILRTLGATRARILKAHAWEYLIIAVATAAAAVVLGALAAWVALRQVMEVDFQFSGVAVAQALALAIGLVLLFGGGGTLRVLRARPVPHLRSD